jgi:DNA-binding LacI/PurR family transcriptional regulator
MSRLNYTPSRAAQSLARGSTNILGLMVPDIANGFFAGLAKGAEAAAREAGFNLLLANTGFDHRQERTYLEMISSRAVDGVVYAAGLPPKASELGELLQGLPTVLVDESIPGSGLDTVVSDNVDGGRLIAQHLKALGHSRCLIIDAPSAPTSSQDRVGGFVSAWQSAGGQWWTESGDFTYRSGCDALKAAVTTIETQRISCIFAANDLMALGALRELLALGFQVPNDISVAGFDDIFDCTLSTPELTSIHQAVDQLGRMAVDALIGRISDPWSPPSSAVIPVTLMPRGSTGPATQLRSIHQDNPNI